MLKSRRSLERETGTGLNHLFQDKQDCFKLYATSLIKLDQLRSTVSCSSILRQQLHVACSEPIHPASILHSIFHKKSSQFTPAER